MARKKKKSAARRIVIALISIVAVIAIVFLGFIGYVMLPVSSYYSASEAAFEIPGLDGDFVPQNVCYDAARDSFILSGYSATDEASPIYIVDRKTGDFDEVRLKKEDGSDFTGHSGGIAVWRDYVYIAGGADYCVYVFSYADLLDGDTATCLGNVSFKTDKGETLRASFLTVLNADIGAKLVVGEFYNGDNYLLPESHKVVTAAGDEQHALAFVFDLTPDAEFGVVPTPKAAWSIPDKSQGACYASGDKILFSTSYGLAHSYVYEYDLSKAPKSQKTISFGGNEIPLLELDSASRIGEYKLPPMSGGIIYLDDKLYTIYESASNKYIFGKFTLGQFCYATDLSKMK